MDVTIKPVGAGRFSMFPVPAYIQRACDIIATCHHAFIIQVSKPIEIR